MLHGMIKVTTEYVLYCCTVVQIYIPLSTELSISVLPVDFDRSSNALNNLKIQVSSLKVTVLLRGPPYYNKTVNKLDADHLLSSHHLYV